MLLLHATSSTRPFAAVAAGHLGSFNLLHRAQINHLLPGAAGDWPRRVVAAAWLKRQVAGATSYIALFEAAAAEGRAAKVATVSSADTSITRPCAKSTGYSTATDGDWGESCSSWSKE